MDRFLQKNKVAVSILLVTLTIGASFAKATNRKHSSRHIYIRGVNKVYTLLTPTLLSKSMAQMQAEANSGRTRFKNLFDAGVEPTKNLLQFMTPVKDQGHRGTCVAFASMALIETQIKEKTGQTADLSEQYAYWASKAIDKINPNGDGSDPIGLMKTMETQGVPAEKAWPYEKEPWFSEKTVHKDCYVAYKANPDDVPMDCVTNGEPPAPAKAAPRVTVSRVQNVETSPETIIGFLAKGIAVEVALDVYDKAWGFNNPESKNFLSGIVSMPAAGDTPTGGHAILIVGYNKDQRAYLFKNSWGTDEWASQSQTPGFGVIPMDYVRKFGEATVAMVNQ